MAAMPTEEEMAYMQEHIHDTLVPNVIASCAISSGFAVVIAALRVYVRYTTIKKLILSDYLMITSVVSTSILDGQKIKVNPVWRNMY